MSSVSSDKVSFNYFIPQSIMHVARRSVILFQFIFPSIFGLLRDTRILTFNEPRVKIFSHSVRNQGNTKDVVMKVGNESSNSAISFDPFGFPFFSIYSLTIREKGFQRLLRVLLNENSKRKINEGGDSRRFP